MHDELVGQEELAHVAGAYEIHRLDLRGVVQAESLCHLLRRLERIFPLSALQPLHLRLRAVVPREELAVGPAEVVQRVELVALVAEAELLVGTRALEPHEERGAVLLTRARPALVRGAEDDVAPFDAAETSLAAGFLLAVRLGRAGGLVLGRGIFHPRSILSLALRPLLRVLGGAVDRLGRRRVAVRILLGNRLLRGIFRRLWRRVDRLRLGAFRRGASGRHGSSGHSTVAGWPIRCRPEVTRAPDGLGCSTGTLRTDGSVARRLKKLKYR